MVDIPSDPSTGFSLSVGGSLTDRIEVVGDHDWIRLQLTAGQQVVITLNGTGTSPLVDPYLYLLDSAGNVLVENDDSGSGTNSRIVFTATSTGTYYIDVGSYEPYDGNPGTGSYTVSVDPYTPPPVYTLDQAANQLTHGYWDGDWHHFNVTQGGSLTVNLTALTAAGQNLARHALALWTDIIGVNFVEVVNGGQIVFDDTEPGAYSSSVWANHIISSSDVNISTDWLTTYGTSLNGYGFQTYIHEIGHALGLGHAGNYDGDATYPDDALYANDAWPTSVMSYFAQSENTYFSDQGFDYNYVVTPMVADILAMQFLYGLSTTTRLGNTTYGTDWSINMGALTIFDSGGNDTIDLADRGGGQRIDLDPGAFSNVLGETGNVAIGPTTIIENARTGNGADTLLGNSAANLLESGAGNDTLNGRGGNDRLAPGTGNNQVNGGAGIDLVDYSIGTTGAVNVNLTTGVATNGAGTDTLISIENVRGTNYADTITGNNGANELDGRGGADSMTGGGGDDTYIVNNAGDTTVEGASAGSDTVYSSVNYTLSSNVENLYLTGSAVRGTGNSGVNRLIGNDAANILDGGAGADIMRGGVGDDAYYVDNALDGIAEFAGEGTDIVYSSITYALRSNIEDLTLTGTAVRAAGNNLVNRLVGTDSANILNGGLGADAMHGGGGNDIYYVETVGDHTIEESGAGRDRVYSLISWSLETNVEDAFARGSANISLNGNGLDNVLVGNSGNNSLVGRGGQDTVRGALGSDTFVFREGDFGGSTSSTADRIIDFSHAEGDHIRLDSVDADLGADGDQAFNFIGDGAFSHSAGELRYEVINGNTYVSGDTNGDGLADFMLRLDGGHNLVGGDFIL